MAHRSAGEATLVAALLILLGAGIVYPLLQVLSVAFLDGGVPTLRPLAAFFARPLFHEAAVNTLLTGVLAVLVGSVIAVPLALLTVRYRFPGRALVTGLGVLPLVIPPFVGAVAFQQILGRGGAVNLLLLEHAGFTIPFMEGLTGVVLVQSLHYFPFILLSTAAALAGLDRSLEEAAQNLGSSGLRLFRRVLLPLALPGYMAGALLTRIGAAFIGPVVATTLLSSMRPAAVYLVLAGLGLAMVPLVARLGRRSRPREDPGETR